MHITVQRGWHFSSHEQWKLLELPYLDDALMRVVFENGEKVRTLNSVLGSNGERGALPGMYASVNAPFADYGQQQPGYDGMCGIPALATGDPATFEFDVVTPYSLMPVFLLNRTAASAWLLNMLRGAAMQNVYGSTERVFANGTAVCPMTTWDSTYSISNRTPQMVQRNTK